MNSPVVGAVSIKGWMSIEELEWLYRVAQRMNSIVELGSFEGRSTYVLLSGCKGEVFPVDVFWCGTMFPYADNEQYTRPSFERNCGHFPNLGPIFEGTSEEAAASGFIPAEVDCVFIDADHAYESVLNDLKLWEPRARKIVCGHDMAPETPGVQRALDEYFGAGQVHSGLGSLWYIDK